VYILAFLMIKEDNPSCRYPSGKLYDVNPC